MLFLLALSPAHLAASELTLAWDPNTEPDLAGYNLYYGTQSGAYDFVIDVGNITQYTLAGLSPDTTHTTPFLLYFPYQKASSYHLSLDHVQYVIKFTPTGKDYQFRIGMHTVHGPGQLKRRCYCITAIREPTDYHISKEYDIEQLWGGDPDILEVCKSG